MRGDARVLGVVSADRSAVDGALAGGVLDAVIATCPNALAALAGGVLDAVTATSPNALAALDAAARLRSSLRCGA